MGKVVYNACYGGFGLSDAAVKRYAEIKGLTLYPERGRFGFTTWWTVPASERGAVIRDDDWHSRSLDERIASNKFHKDHAIYDRDIARDDPALVQVVEELGDEANGAHSKLRVEDISPGTRYRISEYDGYESVEVADDVDWSVAK